MVSVEVVAVDTTAGKAVVREADRWYLVARDREWHPLDVDGQQAQFLSAAMLPIRQPCSTFAEAMAEVRRICAGGLPPTRPVVDLWEERLHRFGGLLDWFFERKGCSVDESFHLTLGTFLRLKEQPGPVDESDISSHLYQIAMEVCPRSPGTLAADQAGHESPPADPGPAGPLRVLEGARLDRAILGCERQTLRCLYHWAVLGKNHKKTARLEGLSVDEVRSHLFRVATRLGRSAVQLRHPDVVQACIRVVKGSRG